jgi:hypothetical protein
MNMKKMPIWFRNMKFFFSIRKKVAMVLVTSNYKVLDVMYRK